MPRKSWLFLLSAALAACAPMATIPTNTGVFKGRFEPLGPNGIVTNEYAHSNPRLAGALVKSDWEVTSGSLFAKDGAGWTGMPDDKNPDASSERGNNSAVFRMRTKRSDFKDVDVRFRLLNRGLHSTPSTPAQGYDGVHIFLRYVSDKYLYYATINRRDNKVIIKKKIPGGESNGGTYYELSPYVPYEVPFGRWQQIRATVKDVSGGAVEIQLFADGRRLVSAVDNGDFGGPPIREAGRIGLRADNTEALFADFEAVPLDRKPAEKN